MKPLQQLWQTIESIPGPTAVAATWQELLGTEYEFASSYLRPTGELAASYPRIGNAGCNIPYTVVEHGPEDYVGVSPEGGDTITLTRQDLIIYELDRKKLQHAVAGALGIEYEESNVPGLPDTQRIGTYLPCAGYAFPAYLAIPLESSDLTRAVHTLAAIPSQPFILLAPTRRRLRSEAETVIRAADACFLPLDEALAVNDRGIWVATPVAQQAIESFKAAHLPATEDTSGVVFFPTPPGAKWSDVHIRFVDGETVSIRVRGVSGTYLYSQIGMVDRRNKKPTKQWELLRSFARGYGVITWESPDADRRNQKRREYLARDLKSFFRIDGEPIILTDDKKGWRTVFSIEPDV